MAKRLLCLAAAVSVMFCITVLPVFAQGGTSAGSVDYGAKLKALKAQRDQLRGDYENGVDEINADTNGKVRQLKKGYRKACQECMKEKEAAVAQLRKDYEDKAKPVIEEENRVRAEMAPGERMNFAKPKGEKKK